MLQHVQARPAFLGAAIGDAPEVQSVAPYPLTPLTEVERHGARRPAQLFGQVSIVLLQPRHNGPQRMNQREI